MLSVRYTAKPTRTLSAIYIVIKGDYFAHDRALVDLDRGGE